MKELRLVIVDDEELAIQNLEEQIEAINGPYRIVGTARNGMQAWELLQKVKPDVAFIDIKIPVLTGLELAKKIKDEHMKTEVVLVSAYQEFEYAKQGIELGICQYILKHEVGGASLSKLLEQLWNKWNTEQITTTFSVQSICFGCDRQWHLCPVADQRTFHTSQGGAKDLFYPDGTEKCSDLLCQQRLFFGAAATRGC